MQFPRLFEADIQDRNLLTWLEPNRERLEAAFRASGAVLLRGFDIPGEEAFQRGARALAGSLESQYGDLVKRRPTSFVYDATWYPADRAILFHNEGSHTPRLPTRQFFYCGEDAFTGGETPIVDCCRVLASLDADLRRRFEEHGLIYLRNFIRGVDVSWQDFFRTNDHRVVEQHCRERAIEFEWSADGSLRTRTRAPAVLRPPTSRAPSFCNQLMLHHVACLDGKTRDALLSVLEPDELPRNVYFGDGSPIPEEVVSEVLRVTAREAVRFNWQRGDLLMLDNLVTAHARSPFSGKRQILVAVGDVIERATSTTKKIGEYS